MIQEVDKINEKFDAVMEKPFTNPNLIIQAVQVILQGCGVNLPNIHPGSDDEYVFKLEEEEDEDGDDDDDDLYLVIYINKSETPGGYDGYAQFVTGDELEELEDDIDDDDVDELDDDELDDLYEAEVEQPEAKPSAVADLPISTSNYLRQVRHSADD